MRSVCKVNKNQKEEEREETVREELLKVMRDYF